MTENKNSKQPTHRWKFFRYGGFDQVCLHTAADLLALNQLDQKLWAALSCPTRGVEMDTKTLDMLDTDQDGRIRVPEILAAVKWATSALKDPADLIKGEAALPLAAINDETAEGRELLASARQILRNLGKPEAAIISAEDTADTLKIFAETRFNGDGIICASTSDEETVQAVINDIIACLSPETDRSGAPGVSLEQVETFFTEAQAYADWWQKSQGDASILPLGQDTHAAALALAAAQTKIDDYFTRCRLAAFDPRATVHLNCAEDAYNTLAPKDLSAESDDIAAFPLAMVGAASPLPLKAGINPAWVDVIARLDSTVIQPLLGPKEALSEADWASLKSRFGPYQAWQAEKAGAVVEPLGLERVQDLLAGSAKATLLDLIEQDRALEPEVNAIASVDRLVHYHRDLYQLLNNFVSLRDFYTRKAKAVFQAGTLYLDGRSCELCVKVDDIAKHSTLANLSGTYLAYCHCTRKGSAETMTIAAAFTGGDSDNLMVGRNGIFYDRQGQDWDANIVKLIEHPISIRQAFWSPYKRMARMISQQAEKFAAAREKAVDSSAAAGIETAGKGAEAGKAPAAAPFDVGKFAGIFAAIGLAIGAIGTALAAVVTGFLGLVWWQMPLAIVGLMLLISGPSMLLAALKLRQRNLAPILDANGWAVNTRAIINIPFGGALTQVAELPGGSERLLDDPYASKKRHWKLIIFLIVLLALITALWPKGSLREWHEQGHMLPWDQEPAVEEPAPAAPADATAPAPAP